MFGSREGTRPREVVLAVLSTALLGLTPDVARAQTGFTDVTVTAGVDYQQHAPQTPPNCVFVTVCDLDRMSGGAAVADVDRDGDPDLYVTRLDAPDILFENQGDGTFVDVTLSAGLAGFDLQSNGAAFGDVDNDGDPDLFVVVLATSGDPVNGRNFLFINDGAGHFSEEAIARGADLSTALPRALWSVNFGDYDRDGWLDVHLTEWSGAGSHGRLLRNLGVAGPGHFEDATDAAGLDFVGVRGFASTFVDLDGDGWQDLAVAADFGTSRLYWNDGDGTFRDGTIDAGVGTDENGMGSTFGDFDLDGDLDWFVTSIFDPDATCEQENCNWGYTGNRLYRNEGDRVFSDATDDAGVRDGFWGWGTAFLDFDNDGDEDLVMTNGVDFPGTSIDAAWEHDPMRFWINDGSGVMTEASAALGVDDTGSGKGLLTFDYDGDGDLDLFVVNNGDAPRLYRNDLASENDWLRVQVEGVRTNRDGLGVQVWVQTHPEGPSQYREVGAAAHFLGQSENVLHFGLGATRGKVEKVTLYFPASGRLVHHMNVKANETLVVRERAKGCGKLGAEPIAALAVIPWVRWRRRKRAS